MGNNLRQRVNERATSTEVATQTPDGEATLAQYIRAMEKQFADAMPRGTEAAQLVRDALTALRTTPRLAECDRLSVLGGLMTCAQLGLRPNVNGLGHAWLLPFWDRSFELPGGGKGGRRAQLIIGYQGYRELAQRSGQVADVIGRIAHEKDKYAVAYGLNEKLEHEPFLDGPRGPAKHYYAIVRYTNGGYSFWTLSRSEVEEHRDKFAMAKKDGGIVGPWRDNFDEMAVKTVFLKLAKWMPKSTELAAAVEADGTVRVDLTPNTDAMFYGERPGPESTVDGEVVGEQSEAAVGDPENPTEQEIADVLSAAQAREQGAQS
jgi:recombination protein RecT